MLVKTALMPNKEFSRLPSDEQIERTAQALEANGILTYIAENGEEAREIVIDLIPQGAEVYVSNHNRWRNSASLTSWINPAATMLSGQKSLR